LTVLVQSVDGENSGFVIDERFETGSFGVGLVGVGGGLDVGVERRVLDWCSVEGNIDGVVSRGSNAVFDVIGTVSVVLDCGLNVLGSRDLDLEGIATSSDWLAVSIDGGDLEGIDVIGLSGVESRAFGKGLSSVTLLDEWVERRSGNVLATEGDVNGVETGLDGSVTTLVQSSSGILEVGGDFSLEVSLDLDVERIVTGRHVVSVLVLGLDVEWSVLANASSFDTRAIGVGVGGRGS